MNADPCLSVLIRGLDLRLSACISGEGFLMAIKKVGVLGCGLMGSGIAQVSASTGFDVTVLEAEQRFLDKGFASIEKSLDKFVGKPPEKGGISAEHRKDIRAHLKGTTNSQDLAHRDIIVEQISENAH